MSELAVSSLSDLVRLAPLLWERGLESVPQYMRMSGMVKEIAIPANSGNTREFTEIDLQEYAKTKDEDDQAERAQTQQGYSVTMTQKRIALDIGISYELRTQNKYPEIVQRLTNLGSTVSKRMDLDLSHRLTFATSTSYVDQDGATIDITVGDGYALAHTAHTVRGSSETYRNQLANNPRISKGALEGMERLIAEQTINQFGEKMSDMTFDILWTTDEPNSVNTAREYLQASADVEGSHSGVPNVYMSKYRHVICPRVATDANGAVDTSKRYYWGLASSSSSSFYLGIWETPRLKVPADLNAGEDFSTDAWSFGARGGYGIAIVNPAWLKFSLGDSTA
jgi:hypothetical protein